MTPAFQEASIAASPSVGPTSLTEITSTGSGQRAALDQDGELAGLGDREVSGDLGGCR